MQLEPHPSQFLSLRESGRRVNREGFDLAKPKLSNSLASTGAFWEFLASCKPIFGLIFVRFSVSRPATGGLGACERRAQVTILHPEGNDFPVVISGANNNALSSLPRGKRIVYRKAWTDAKGRASRGSHDDHAGQRVRQLFASLRGDSIAVVRNHCRRFSGSLGTGQ